MTSDIFFALFATSTSSRFRGEAFFFVSCRRTGAYFDASFDGWKRSRQVSLGNRSAFKVGKFGGERNRSDWPLHGCWDSTRNIQRGQSG